MEITYTKQGDYLLPNLTLKETKKGKINKYERMRLDVEFKRDKSKN